MTQLEIKIQSLEAAIRATQTALIRPKNARDRARNIIILAGLNQDLEELKLQHTHDEAVKENNEVWDKIAGKFKDE